MNIAERIYFLKVNMVVAIKGKKKISMLDQNEIVTIESLEEEIAQGYKLSRSVR